MSRYHVISVGLMLSVAAPIFADPANTPKVPKELLEKRLKAAENVWKQRLVRLQNLQGRPSELFGWSERVLDAQLSLCQNADERAKALKAHLNRTKEVERVATQYARTGQGMQSDAEAATYDRMEAEIRMVKEGIEPNPAKEQKGKPKQ